MGGLEYWRLLDELTIDEAAKLVVGQDPDGTATDAKGFMPVRTAIGIALVQGLIKGKCCYGGTAYERSLHHDDPIYYLRSEDSTVQVQSLKDWLLERGVASAFFFPEHSAQPGYLDPEHQNYSPKLAACINAWIAVQDSNISDGRSVKQRLENWLKENAQQYQLVHADGKLVMSAIEELAKVANWDQKGGAPKTPG